MFEKIEKPEVTPAANKKVAKVIMTDARKFVFNTYAKRLILDPENPEATVAVVDILVDAETGNIGFRFNKTGAFNVKVSSQTLTINVGKVVKLGEKFPKAELKTDKWSATVAWNKEAQAFVADFAETAESVEYRPSKKM